MGVVCGLVEEQVLHHDALHRRKAGGDVMRVRVGLKDVFALNIEALERAIDRGVEHVRNAQPGLFLERHAPQ